MFWYYLNVWVVLVVVDKVFEVGLCCWIVDGFGLFVGEGGVQVSQFFFQMVVQIEFVIDDDVVQIVDIVFYIVQLWGSVGQFIGGVDVEYYKVVEIFDECIVIEVCGQQIGVMWFYFVIIVYVQVLVFFGGDDFDVFVLSFGIFVGVVGDVEFYFVWGVDVFVVVFQFYVEVDVVVNVVVVSGVVDVGFCYLQCFGVGVVGFEFCFNQLLLDFWQVVFLCVKQVDVLRVGDFGVQIEFMGDMVYGDQFFWCDFVVS